MLLVLKKMVPEICKTIPKNFKFGAFKILILGRKKKE